jgi:hypothetical protein
VVACTGAAAGEPTAKAGEKAEHGINLSGLGMGGAMGKDTSTIGQKQ